LQLVPRANCLNWELPVSYGLPERIIWREPVNRPISTEVLGSEGAVTEQINSLLGDACQAASAFAPLATRKLAPLMAMMGALRRPFDRYFIDGCRVVVGRSGICSATIR